VSWLPAVPATGTVKVPLLSPKGSPAAVLLEKTTIQKRIFKIARVLFLIKKDL
jgi:hypothetical protein